MDPRPKGEFCLQQKLRDQGNATPQSNLLIDTSQGTVSFTRYFHPMQSAGPIGTFQMTLSPELARQAASLAEQVGLRKLSESHGARDGCVFLELEFVSHDGTTKKSIPNTDGALMSAVEPLYSLLRQVEAEVEKHPLSVLALRVEYVPTQNDEHFVLVAENIGTRPFAIASPFRTGAYGQSGAHIRAADRLVPLSAPLSGVKTDTELTIGPGEVLRLRTGRWTPPARGTQYIADGDWTDYSDQYGTRQRVIAKPVVFVP